MVGSVLAALASAFVTGALARFAVPGPDPMPIWLTVAIGLLGTVIGGGIVLAAVGPEPEWVGIAAFLVSVGLVIAYRRVVQRRPLWGPGAYRFPKRGVGIEQYRERLERAGIDPDTITSPLAAAAQQQAPAGRAPAAPVPVAVGDDPTENPAHYLQLLEELHDNGVLEDSEYDAARGRLLARLRE